MKKKLSTDKKDNRTYSTKCLKGILFLDSDVFCNWDHNSDLYSMVPTKLFAMEKKI